MALEGAYAFDDVGATTVLDLSGNGRHISLVGTNSAQVNSGGLLDGGAFGKTGVNTVSLPAALRTASETDDRTLMFDGLGQRAVWWVRWENLSLNTGMWGLLSLDSANIITRARSQGNGNPTPAGTTVGALSNTVRHNFAMTYVRSTGTVTYYYDGAAIGTQAFTAGTALFVGADDLNMGEWTSTGPAIDNLRIYSHALTALEVADVAGTPVASTTSTVTGSGAVALGALTTTTTGVRSTTGVTSATLTGPATSAIGRRTVSSTSAASLGTLTATASATRTVRGTAVASLGSLTAFGNVPGSLPDERLNVSGREPPTRLSGREPRSSI